MKKVLGFCFGISISIFSCNEKKESIYPAYIDFYGEKLFLGNGVASNDVADYLNV